MSNAYRIHGARFLRKYSAADRSSIYSYMADVRTIANTLCKVPWTRVSADITATTTIHTEEGLDWNEPERDRFDAAEWCGEHSDGFHRAFAQAACYVFKLPTSAIGTDIEKLRIQVTGDAYNPYGARISAMTSATLDIPMDCATVREGEVFRAPDEDGMGAAPRLFLRNKDGSQQWYSNTELVELTPETPLTAKQYLFVFVCLENYNRGRDGWIEGSSYIDNDIELTLGTACEDLAEDELNDLSAVVTPVEIPIVEDGVVPDVTGNVGSVVAVNVTASGTSPVFGDDRRLALPGQVADELSPANSSAGIWTAYGRFMAGMSKVCDILEGSPDRRRCGVGFAVRKAADIPLYDADGVSYSPSVITLTASSFLLPFSIPSETSPASIVVDWSRWLTSHLADAAAVFNVWLKDGEFVTEYPEDVLRNPAIYDARQNEVGGWSLLKKVNVSEASLSVPVKMTGRTATLLMTAYLPPEAVNGGAGEFVKGSCPIWYNDFTPDDLVPISRAVFPRFSEDEDYLPGDRVSRGTRLDFVSSPAANNILKAGEKFFGVFGGVVKSSDDLITWSSTGIEVGSGLEMCVNHCQRYFIGTVGYRPSMYSSDDGVTFSQCEIEIPSYFVLTDFIVAGNNILGKALDLGGGGGVKVYVSYDGGDSWTEHPNLTGSKYTGFFAIGASVMIQEPGSVHVSSDGVTWTDAEFANSLINNFIHFGSKYFASASNRIYSSVDGLTWTDETGELSGIVKTMLILRDKIVAFAGYDVVVSYGNGSWNVVHTLEYSPNGCYIVRGEIFAITRLRNECKMFRSADARTWVEVQGVGDFLDVVQLGNGMILGYGTEVNTKFYIMTEGGVFDFYDHGTPITGYLGGIVRSGDDWFRVFGESAFVCIEDASAGIFDSSKWKVVESGARNRFNGVGDLCIPDVKLIV